MGMSLVSKKWRNDDDGHLIHDGDCCFWDRRVCTCGLLHNLRPQAERGKALVPDLYKQFAAQDTVMELLLMESKAIIKEADRIMEQDDSPLTPEEQEKFDALLQELAFGPQKD